LIEFLDVISNRSNNVEVNKVVYHTGNTAYPGSILANELKRLLATKVPHGTNFYIKRWPDEALHDRFVLTNLGGVQIGHGLDDDDFADKEITTMACLKPEHAKTRTPKTDSVPYMDSNLIYDIEVIM